MATELMKARARIPDRPYSAQWSMEELDPLFKALTLFRQRKFVKAGEFCDRVLAKNPLDQVRRSPDVQAPCCRVAGASRCAV